MSGFGVKHVQKLIHELFIIFWEQFYPLNTSFENYEIHSEQVRPCFCVDSVFCHLSFFLTSFIFSLRATEEQDFHPSILFFFFFKQNI